MSLLSITICNFLFFFSPHVHVAHPHLPYPLHTSAVLFIILFFVSLCLAFSLLTASALLACLFLLAA
ncbi:hypothetical protein V8C40DRAFT_256493 [Trichoderma camerunense]